MRLFKALIIITSLIASNWIKAAEHADFEPQQQFNLAIDRVKNKEYLEAFTIFSTLSENGWPEAQFNLSLLYFSGLGSPKNFKLSLYWAWMAHLNLHSTANDRVDDIFGLITENLRNDVAQQVVDELLAEANSGDQVAPLKLGKTYLGLFVEPNYEAAYVWLSIAQAYGDEQAPNFLEQASSQLAVEVILQQQEQSQQIFQSIISKN